MKRFYAETRVEREGEGFCVLLDGRPLKTPKKQILLLPDPGLASVIAEEWEAQADEIVPDVMPITRLATTATDRMPELREAAIRDISDYAGTDLVCYRAANPVELMRRQHDAWQPALDWMAKRYDIAFETTASLLPTPQPDATLVRVRSVIAAIDDWPLVGVHAATAALGSVVLALALGHGVINANAAADASLVDALFEIERWGEEQGATERHQALRRDVHGAALYLRHFPPGD